MKYTTKYFRDNLPPEKKKKDSIIARFFLRPLSFLGASLACQLGLTANQVSFIGVLIAYLAAALLIIPNKICNIFGGIAIILWGISDCVDGNLARSVQKQPFGEFIDACGSYTIVALVLPAAGFAAYHGQCAFLNYNPIVILMGALAGTADCLTRLYFQKYKNEERELPLSDQSKKQDSVRNSIANGRIYDIYSRIAIELSGLFGPFLFFSIIFNFMDIFVAFYGLFYIMIYFVSFAVLLKKCQCLKKPENYGSKR